MVEKQQFYHMLVCADTGIVEVKEIFVFTKDSK